MDASIGYRLDKELKSETDLLCKLRQDSIEINL